MAGALEYCDEATMKRLLIFDILRGSDSTGLGVLRNNGEAKVLKVAGHALDLLNHKDLEAVLTGSLSKVFLGHNCG